MTETYRWVTRYSPQGIPYSFLEREGPRIPDENRPSECRPYQHPPSKSETWELVRCDRQPVMGELRYVRVLIPSPDALAKLWQEFRPMLWDGNQWRPLGWRSAEGMT